MKAATEDDWYTEYLAPILAVRVVDSLDDGIVHIATYGSQHTDAIVTQDHANAMRFLREVDSSSVLVNASTVSPTVRVRAGAEIGISTNKPTRAGRLGSRASRAGSGSCWAPDRSDLIDPSGAGSWKARRRCA